MTPAIRLQLILDDLTQAVLDGRLPENDRYSASWLLWAFNGVFPLGTSTNLIQRVRAVCPLIDAPLDAEAPAAVPTQRTLPTPVESPDPQSGIRGFGLQPQE